MLRARLNLVYRSYVTVSKRTVASRTISKAVPKASAIPEPPVFDEELFFEPPEFALQTGQPKAAPQSQAILSTTSSALKGLPLNEKFTATLDDQPESPVANEINWATSYYGLGSQPFSESIQQALSNDLAPEDIEIKPDGLIYLPEIKYRRILNKAFGAGGWGLVARSKTIVTDKLLTREYGLVCHGRLVGIARGEQDYFSAEGIPTATEGCKSNALMRCCKDLGIASELWDPNFIRAFKVKYCEDKFVEHVTTKRKRKIWKRKDRGIDYPYKLT